jgi:hypothetical protein
VGKRNSIICSESRRDGATKDAGTNCPKGMYFLT